jgi:ribosomal protein L37AE/L43A
MSSFSCQWDDCKEKFATLQRLQDHLFRHVNETQPKAGLTASPTKAPSKNLPVFSIDKKQDMGKGKEKIYEKDPVKIYQSSKPAISKKEEDDLKCQICASGREFPRNLIVICDGCDQGFHQICHQPNIPDSILRIQNSKWFCRQCSSD